jgi:hypothetical protein
MAAQGTRRPAWKIATLALLGVLLAAAAGLLFLLGMCIGDGLCGESETRMRLAYGGALAGAAFGAGALAAAPRPRPVPVLAAAAAGLALMAYAITQVRA